MSLVSQDPEFLSLGTLYEIQQNDDIGLGVYILAMYKVLIWNYILVSNGYFRHKFAKLNLP